jgi:integrase
LEGILCKRVAKIKNQDVSELLTSDNVVLCRTGRPKLPTSVNRTKVVVRAFWHWCEATGRTSRDPARHVRLAPAPVSIRARLSAAELRRLLRTINTSRHRLAERDYALFTLLSMTGIRLSNAIQLRVGDLDLEEGSMILARTKRGGSRVCYLPERLRPLLTKLTRGCGRDEPVFRGRGGLSLCSRAVQYRFHYWCTRAQLEQAHTVHSLRHTFGCHLYRETGDLLLVGHALGHKDFRSTAVYARPDEASSRLAIESVASCFDQERSVLERSSSAIGPDPSA